MAAVTWLGLGLGGGGELLAREDENAFAILSPDSDTDGPWPVDGKSWQLGT